MLDYESIVTILMVGLLVYFSLDFNKHYVSGVHDAARHPIARFLAGLAVVLLANEHPSLAAVLLVIVFFWIADVNLLSSFEL